MPTSPQERFERHVVIGTNGCRLWTASLDKKGYGQFNYDGKGQIVRAHRAAWKIYRGEWPRGILRHSCDVRPCVELNHLLTGNFKDNTQDMIERGRCCSGERHPFSKLTLDQVRAIRSDIRSQSAIALEYKIAQSTVCRIRRGSKWRLD